MSQRTSDLDEFLDNRANLRKIGMRFGTWSVRILYRVGSSMRVSKEIQKYKFVLMVVQKVGWDKVGIRIMVLFGSVSLSSFEIVTTFCCIVSLWRLNFDILKIR
jgi:hypothetical protein